MSDRPEPPVGEQTVFIPDPGKTERREPSRPLARHAMVMGYDRDSDDVPRPPAGAAVGSVMMIGATPLLSLIAGVRSGRVTIDLPRLHQRATAAATRFDECLSAGKYDAETRRRARYAVYATIDDIAQNLPASGGRSGTEWARRSMVVRAFGENIGGDRFWALLDDMLSRPAQHAELLELYHACLAVGFEGRHRVSPDGRNKLRAILNSSFAALPQSRGQSDVDLVPHWRGSPKAPPGYGAWTPLTLAASIALGLVLLMLLAYRILLIETGQPATNAVLAINPERPLRLSRAAPPPPTTADAQQQRVAGFLHDEIAQRLVTVEEDANSLRVRTTVGALFRSGSDALEPGRAAIFERIAHALQSEPGPVRVEGHADSDQVHSLTFPDNMALSTARAETVATILRAGLRQPDRVSAQGFGSSRPLTSNDTAAGKATNRRVEIVIPRNEQ
ncbi:type IVB secretion system protein IcmH/DotU [Sphingomonas sp. NFR15]|uniref:type IVB secretion system protein IcmH/DotU n=1 Tax=Sphingomonas sp. NFR15 TaxID=1566282 RepID=UPI00089268FC|nr:type IVB secretion system protein IcmH/DotU [Sphingomonas sp. NFR15]SDA24704.1 type VI secretion system protein ImpK [Sphingomonas sp. NFR15]